MVLFLEGNPPVTRPEHTLCPQESLAAKAYAPGSLSAAQRHSAYPPPRHGQLLSTLLIIVTPNNFWKWIEECSNGI